jgi:hypothetical protein
MTNPIHTYVLRTTDQNLRSKNDFQYPGVGGIATAPDWDPKPECGYGLHGFLHGVGDAGLADWSPSARWLVLKVETSSLVVLEGGEKVKFPSGEVCFVGDMKGATAYLDQVCPEALAKPVIGATRSVGHKMIAISGYRGVSISGDRGTATSGDRGTSTSGGHGTSSSGDGGTSSSGDGGTATSGRYGASTSGYQGTSTSGYQGTSTSGDGGTSTSGDGGTSTSGEWGTSTSGDRGTSRAGVGGKVRAGASGTLSLRCPWDGGCYREVLAYVGEAGILPDTFYRLDETKNFMVVG